MTQWQAKDPSENFVVDFDFAASPGIITSATVTAELVSGVDAAPENILVATRTISNRLVQQRVGVGQPGCRYRFKCVASDGTNTFTIYTSMPVVYTANEGGQVTITDYTSYAEVRAALGVTDKEVGDEILGLPMYGNHLAAELNDLADTLGLTSDIDETYATLRGITLSSLTKPQKRVLATVALFATYAVARHLGTSLAMMAPKTLGDGKAMLTRFSDSPYKSTLANVEAQYEKAKVALSGALASLNSTSTVAVVTSFMGVSSPAVDPVTGS